MTTSNLSRLLNPKSVAVIGGGAWCEAVFEQLQKWNFSGKIYSVHPAKSEVAGITAYPSVRHLPEVPDATFVGINREASIGAIERLRKMEAGGAIAFASGFAETIAEDATGQGAQERLLKAAGSMPVLGPNCYGFINALDGVAIWPDQHGLVPVERGVAILTQSSNISINMTMQKRGLPIGYMVACGNQAQTSQPDIAAALLDDPRVTAIGLHIEGFGDLRAWEGLAQKAREVGKPLVALKVGKSTQAQAATVSHTASMAGGDAGAAALLKRLRIARANDLPGFMETLKLFHMVGHLDSNRIASISCSGGEASLMADLAIDYDVEFPPLNETQKKNLRAALGPKVALANPLDYHTYIWRDTDAMTKAWSAMADPNIALTALVVDYPRADRCDPKDWKCATDAAIAMKSATKSEVAMIAGFPELMPEEVAQELIDGGVVPLCGMSEAMAAIEAASSTETASHEPIILPTMPSDLTTHSEAKSKKFLGEYGVISPDSGRAETTDELSSICEELLFPVALKAEGSAHKSDQGGVALDLNSVEEVTSAANEMSFATSFLVEEMSPPGVELLVGVHLDPAHGFVLTLAAGGVWTEIQKDQVHLLLPVQDEGIRNALDTLRIAPLLHGYRGRPACNIDAIVETVLSVQDYVTEYQTSVAEVEINPLICTTEEAIAVDALIRESL